MQIKHCNKNVDILLSVHQAFLKQPSSGYAHSQKIEKPYNLKYFGTREAKGINRIAHIGLGCLCPRETDVSFHNLLII